MISNYSGRVVFRFYFSTERITHKRVRAQLRGCGPRRWWLRLAIMLSLAALTVLRSVPILPGGVEAANRLSLQPVQPMAMEQYHQQPLSFELNLGQSDPAVKFLSRGADYQTLFAPNEVFFQARGDRQHSSSSEWEPDLTIFGPKLLRKRSAHRSTSAAHQVRALRWQLVNANPAPEIIGLDQLPGRVHYFIGNDPNKWRTNVPLFSRVQYQNIYPGINLVFYGNQRGIEYDFVLQPGADPRQIKFAFSGAQQVQIEETGDLIVRCPYGEMRQLKPLIYQEAGGQRREIEGRFVARSREEIGFEISHYDPDKALVIDPVISFSTFLGGSQDDESSDIALDPSGNVYVVGQTKSLNFLTKNPFQSTLDGPSDIFVTKLSNTGTLVYSAYLGGLGDDSGFGIRADPAGNAYIVGATISGNFPTVAGSFRTVQAGGIDVIIAKLNPGGSQLVYSTYLGGSGADEPRSITIDAAGNAYVTGFSASTNFPLVNAVQTTLGGPSDLFITKLDPAGSALTYSTLLGGGGQEIGNSIAVDSAGNAYVAGATESLTFPTVNPFGSFLRGEVDAVVVKLNSAGNSLLYSSFLGGNKQDSANRIAVDSAGNAYVTGLTVSSDFPVLNAIQPTYAGGLEAFVTKFTPLGNEVGFSSYLGGANNEIAQGLALDSSNNIYVMGTTSSPNFPLVSSLKPDFGGTADVFVTKLTASGLALLYSTYLGGAALDQGFSCAVDSSGNAYLTGVTESFDFPTQNAAQGALSGAADSFVVKLVPDPTGLATTVSAASYLGPRLATESIVAAFGTNLATVTLGATTLPLPTTLGGTTVKVRDREGTERPAALFFVSPTQVNYQIPPGTANGIATLTITAADGKVSVGTVLITSIEPGIFSADASGQGVAAAVVVRVKPGNIQNVEPVARFDPIQNRFVAVPIDLGPPTDQVYLVLFGTGIRFRTLLSEVSVRIGGLSSQVDYAGPQPEFVGLDQINVLLSRSLIGRGEVDVEVAVEGRPANKVRVSIK